MKSIKRVAIFIPNLEGGGAERISVNLANGLCERGFNVDMVLLSATGPFLDLLSPRVRVINLQVNKYRWSILPLIGYLRKVKPDTMLACMWPLTVLAVISRKISCVDTRIVVAEHNTWSLSQVDYPNLLRFVIRISMRLFFPSADAVVAVSQGAADDLSNFACLPRNAVTKIFNPVVDTFKEVSDNTEFYGLERWKSASFRILTVGTLKQQKNHKLLLHAFSILLRRVDAHLLILGEGHLRTELETLICKLGINDKVSMPGFVKNPSQFYRAASLFVLSSDWEGLPTVLIEALAFGTPIVSTDCPSGPREILCDGQFGYLVPIADADALATAMADSLSATHDELALKTRANDFSINNALNLYEAILFNSEDSKSC
jgi:glycosyltransferase involved in cell wall biosynthesis